MKLPRDSLLLRRALMMIEFVRPLAFSFEYFPFFSSCFFCHLGNVRESVHFRAVNIWFFLSSLEYWPAGFPSFQQF